MMLRRRSSPAEYIVSVDRRWPRPEALAWPRDQPSTSAGLAWVK
jgi:hypothetical protein